MDDIHFRADETLAQQIDERASALGFTTRAEYIRYVLRNDLQRGMRENDA